MTDNRVSHIDCKLYMDFEERVLASTPPLLSQSKVPLVDRHVSKSMNMSDSCASSFGSGAVEHIQNWFDQCRKLNCTSTTWDRQPLVVEYDSEQFADLAKAYRLKEGIQVFAAIDSSASRALGFLVACESAAAAGKQILLLKNYASRISLDDMILGVSSKQGDTLLAGQKCFDSGKLCQLFAVQSAPYAASVSKCYTSDLFVKLRVR